MRIIGGAWRGRKLAQVGAGDASAHLRPTSDRVRESLFNLLINGGYGNVLHRARVLDVFAGTGALGLEALSRGAAEAVFIENGKAAQKILRENLRLLGASGSLLGLDARAPGPNPGAPFDLLFMDPPYGQSLGEAALEGLRPWLAPEALVVWEESAPPRLAPWLRPLDQRRYGGTVITIARLAPSPLARNPANLSEKSEQ